MSCLCNRPESMPHLPCYIDYWVHFLVHFHSKSQLFCFYSSHCLNDGYFVSKISDSFDYLVTGLCVVQFCL